MRSDLDRFRVVIQSPMTRLQERSELLERIDRDPRYAFDPRPSPARLEHPRRHPPEHAPRVVLDDANAADESLAGPDHDFLSSERMERVAHDPDLGLVRIVSTTCFSTLADMATRRASAGGSTRSPRRSRSTAGVAGWASATLRSRASTRRRSRAPAPGCSQSAGSAREVCSTRSTDRDRRRAEELRVSGRARQKQRRDRSS
jgi:hypothetical protein